MDCKGNLYYSDEEQTEAKKRFHNSLLEHASGNGEKRKIFPITNEQHDVVKPLSEIKRKNYMRNQPCVCGSEKKFKKCCWSKYK